ncbi:5'-nucleotidase SurE [Acaryochloris thomasi RCC1774]|uniref:5'-nucleotidase n=1 Tax=Acaryochloris thomasi RCC1774 TaxID=1764569 RepID=A0A2W1JN38_9CYAN|nr:5'/3'-nucleotidase SurE [Acaryochloris thomasi]PZD74738.1 5'-nucleotidase SurE [Acaryochloris thomasi RCC1774]
MTWLLTNDDGIDAPGLQALAQALPADLGEDVVVVAPMQEQSGCGHQVTTHRPIQIREADPETFAHVQRAYAIAGTPADCVRVALHHLQEEITFVCSGINAGGNLGVDIYMSGTVAAVRESAFYGIPGIALSQYRRGPVSIDWARAARLGGGAIAKLLLHPLERGQFWNINLPHPDPDCLHPDLVFGTSCTHPMPCSFKQENDQLSYQGNYGGRSRRAGADVAICFGGQIAATQIKV